MTPEQIREIVKITLEELTERKLIQPENYRNILRVVDKELYGFFRSNGSSHVGQILRQLSDDPYIDVIYGQYRDDLTLEYIADDMDVSVCTVKRNKKRLIMAIYDRLEG